MHSYCWLSPISTCFLKYSSTWLTISVHHRLLCHEPSRVHTLDLHTVFLCCMPPGFGLNRAFDEYIAEMCSKYRNGTSCLCQIRTLAAATEMKHVHIPRQYLIKRAIKMAKWILKHCKSLLWRVPSATCVGYVTDSPSEGIVKPELLEGHTLQAQDLAYGIPDKH